MTKAIFLTTLVLAFLLVVPGWAQVVGEQAELERLRQWAEDAMALGDPDGAALNIGKAALMASILAKQKAGQELSSQFRGLALFFRAQENTYRAFSIFEKAGGSLPAPSSVCSSLQLGAHQAERAQEHLASTPGRPDQERPAREQIAEWMQTIQEVREDFQCAGP